MPTTKQTRARKSPKKPAASRRCAEATGSVSDTARLDWLIENDASLTATEERVGCLETVLWWKVTKDRSSLSGHPLGDARAAIDAAMARQNAQDETRSANAKAGASGGKTHEHR